MHCIMHCQLSHSSNPHSNEFMEELLRNPSMVKLSLARFTARLALDERCRDETLTRAAALSLVLLVPLESEAAAASCEVPVRDEPRDARALPGGDHADRLADDGGLRACSEADLCLTPRSQETNPSTVKSSLRLWISLWTESLALQERCRAVTLGIVLRRSDALSRAPRRR